VSKLLPLCNALEVIKQTVKSAMFALQARDVITIAVKATAVVELIHPKEVVRATPYHHKVGRTVPTLAPGRLAPLAINAVATLVALSVLLMTAMMS
jgi:hypothetical protein